MLKLKENLFLQILKRPLLVNILTVSAFDMISKATSVVLFILLIRILTVDDYAKLTYFNSVAFFIFGAVGTGISSSYVRFESESVSRALNKKTDLFFFYNVLISSAYIILFTACGVVWPQISKHDFFSAYDLNVILFAAIYSFSLCIQNMNEAFYQARENFKKAGFIFCLKNVAVLVCILLIVLFVKFNITYVVWIYVLTSSGIAIYYFIGIVKKSAIHKFRISEVKDNLRSSSWMTLYCLLLSLFTQMDVFMVSAFLNKEMLANYGVATKYYSLLLTLLPPIMTVLKVRTSKADIIDDVSRQREYIINWIRRTTPIVILIVSSISLCACFAFPIINGPQYSAAIPAFQILSIGVAISYIFAPNVGMLISMRKEKILCLLGLFTCVANLAGNYYFVPRYGINAAALITVLSNAFLNILSTIIVLYISREEKKVLGYNSRTI